MADEEDWAGPLLFRPALTCNRLLFVQSLTSIFTTEYTNDEGRPYFYNKRSGEVTWEKPDILKTETEKQEVIV